MRLWLLALLLLVPVGAQEQQAALAPAQTIVDAVPGIVEAAVVEARRDGTPDLAQRRADELLAFSSGLDALPPLPAGSAAQRHDLPGALRWAVGIAQVAAGLPSDVGSIERDLAACSSEAMPSAQRVRQWLQGGASAQRRLAAFDEALRAAAASAPAGIDVAPLQRAADEVHGLDVGDGSQLVGCVEEAAQAANVTIEYPWTLRLVPDTAWPTASVLAVGTSNDAADVSAFGQTWHTRWANGSFRVRLEVPVDAAIGAHEITIGPATATLQVVPAPARLELRGPARVEPGQAFDLVAVHTTPAPRLAGGTVTWSTGDASPLVEGQARLRVVREAGTYTFTADHPGHARLEASQASFVVAVAPASDAARQAGGAEAPRPDVPWWPLAAVAAIAAVAVAAGRFRPRRRIRFTMRDVEGAEPPLPTGTAPAAMAAMLAWLRHLGRARPGTTVREAAVEEPEMAPLVLPFEEHRYGPRPVPAPAAAPLLRRIVDRLRGKA